MKVAVFTKSGFLSEIEEGINQWLESEALGPENIIQIKQSQSSNEESDILIISV